MPRHNPAEPNRERIAESLLALRENRESLVDQFLRFRRTDGNQMCGECVLGRHAHCQAPMTCTCIHHSLVMAERIAGRIESALMQTEEIVERVRASA